MNTLFEQGYLTGSFDYDSIIKDDIDFIIEKSKDTNNILCRYDIAGKDLIKVHTNKSCTYEQSLYYDKYVEETDKNVYGLFQKWFTVETEIKDSFKKLSFELIKNLYGIDDINKLSFNDEYTMYINGCFINSHIDNDKDANRRICVVLIYLNKEIPEDAIGGNLIIDDSCGNKITVEPKYTNYAILDFAKNNLRHEVTEVKNWNRYAYVNFVSLKPEYYEYYTRIWG